MPWKELWQNLEGQQQPQRHYGSIKHLAQDNWGLRRGASSMASYPDWKSHSRCISFPWLTWKQWRDCGCFSFQTSKLHVPVSLAVEQLKATKARAVSMLLLSEDKKVWHTKRPSIVSGNGSLRKQWWMECTLETSGDCKRGLSRMTRTWKLQCQEMKQGQCQSQGRTCGGKGLRGRRSGPARKSSRACLPGKVDAVTPGTWAIAVLEGTLECPAG